MMKLCILFAVAVGNRLSVDADDASGESLVALEADIVKAVTGAAKPKLDFDILDLMLVPGHEFETLEEPVLSHEMEMKPGEDMVVEIQNSGAARQTYSMYMVQKNGKALPKHVHFGTMKFKQTSFTQGVFQFKTAVKKPKTLLTMGAPDGVQWSITSSDKKNPHTYYTLEAATAAQMIQGFTAITQHHQHDGRAVKPAVPLPTRMRVHKGSQGAFDSRPPFLESKGYTNSNLEFWLAGEAEPVARMKVVVQKASFVGVKKRMAVQIKSGVDPVMLSMFAACSDHEWCGSRMR